MLERLCSDDTEIASVYSAGTRTMRFGKHLGLVGGGVTIIIVIAAIVVSITHVPSVELDAQVTAGSETMSDGTPAKVVMDLLSSGELPEPGANLIRHNGGLDWAVSPNDSTRQITAVTIEQIELTSGDSFLMTLLDDDPTCTAEVKAVVTTSDEQKTYLTIQLWDYCRLTPWSFRPLGDGWKLVAVHWQQPDSE